MIEIGEQRPGEYANVALQPVKGKTAYIGPLSRAALTIMQTAGNQKSYAVVSEAWTIPNRDYWIDMPPLPQRDELGLVHAVMDMLVVATMLGDGRRAGNLAAIGAVIMANEQRRLVGQIGRAHV